jgi:TrmH family RNA methyltransferase
MSVRLDGVVVVLVRTEGARNAGSVARLCGNFGCALRFVDVKADLASKDCLQMAHPCEQLAEDAGSFGSLDDALADCAFAVATSGKIDDAVAGPALDVDRAAALRPAHGEKLALVFGNERTGLAKAEAARCDRVVRLPTPGDVDSLNLASAVAVCLTLLSAAPETQTRASTAARAALLSTWDAALLARGFYAPKKDPAQRPTTSTSMAPRLAELLQKMDLSERDAALLRDMLRCLGGR